MGSYNWILSRQKCPACHQITTIKSQLHIAASFDGDESGRFFDREYYLGDTMSWFTGPDTLEDSDTGNKITPELTGSNTECCYSRCSVCNIEGYVIVTLEQLKISALTAFEHLDKWPDDYYR